MRHNHTPKESLALVNKAIASAIAQLHQRQGLRKDNSLHLMVQNQHKPPCLGCPHYQWVIWRSKVAKTGMKIGKSFMIATPCKAPTRSTAYHRDSHVAEIVRILIKLLEQRAKLVDAMSRADRSAAATIQMLGDYA